MRILVALGTRPEIIKLSPVVQALRRRRNVQADVLWTGQHIELAAGLLDWFELHTDYKATDIVGVSGISGKLAGMVKHCDDVLNRHDYDWIIVQGDTTTAMAAATAGFLNRVPVAHVEAGLRTGDLYSPWPEEYNRRVITICTALHFPPTERAAGNLRAEGVPDHQISMVGNTVVDALLYTRERVGAGYVPLDPEIRSLPKKKKLVLATLHRRENVGPPMRAVLSALRTLAEDGDKLIVLPVHLNPEVRADVLSVLGDTPNVRLLAPTQYPDFVYLLNRAWAVVTDSGGVQEEAPSLGLQVLISRETTERPEVIEAGFGRLVGSDHDAIVDGVRALTNSKDRQLRKRASPFGVGDSGERIAGVLCGESSVGMAENWETVS